MDRRAACGKVWNRVEQAFIGHLIGGA
jgi:hypothetical protein